MHGVHRLAVVVRNLFRKRQTAMSEHQRSRVHVYRPPESPREAEIPPRREATALVRQLVEKVSTFEVITTANWLYVPPDVSHLLIVVLLF